MTRRSSAAGIFQVLAATTLWGAAGLVIHELIAAGLAPLQVVYYSAALSGILLGGALLLFAPRYLYVPRRALPELLLVAFLSSGLSFILYTLAIDLVGVSLATLLNFTAPAWVALLAWRVLGEKVGRGRVLGLAGALAGCVLLVRLYDPGSIRIGLLGAAAGLGSALAWAGYQVFGKRVLRRHHPLTLTAYSAATAALVLLPLQPAPLPTGLGAEAWPWLVGFVLGPSLIGPVLFNVGLRALEAGPVSLLAITQLVVGVLLGVVVAHDTLELPQLVGALLVGASVLSLRPAAPLDPFGPEPLAAGGQATTL